MCVVLNVIALHSFALNVKKVLHQVHVITKCFAVICLTCVIMVPCLSCAKCEFNNYVLALHAVLVSSLHVIDPVFS